jgi:hypothetical protein
MEGLRESPVLLVVSLARLKAPENPLTRAQFIHLTCVTYILLCPFSASSEPSYGPKAPRGLYVFPAYLYLDQTVNLCN